MVTDPPAASSEALRPVAARGHQRRGFVWGRRPAFSLAPVYRQGKHVGYGALCNRHRDPSTGLSLGAIQPQAASAKDSRLQA